MIKSMCGIAKDKETIKVIANIFFESLVYTQLYAVNLITDFFLNADVNKCTIKNYKGNIKKCFFIFYNYFKLWNLTTWV